MIRHLVKLVWNRKRTSLLVMVEIFVSFLVLFAVVALGVYYADNYRRPLGFDYENVWTVNIDMKVTTDDHWTPEMVERFSRLLPAVREFDVVEAAAGSLTVPFSTGGSSSGYDFRGQRLEYDLSEVTDDFLELMRLQLVEGRWFGPEDDGVPWIPVVVTSGLVEQVFPGQSALGQNISPQPDGSGAPPARERRIVGVISDYRKGGEFSGPGHFAFFRTDPSNPQQRPPRNLLLRVRPGTSAEFEQRLMERLQGVVREWSYRIFTLAEARRSENRFRMVPLVVLGLIAGFLMLMVGLGLTGVLWQNVTQRTREIGLRRAKGATREGIYAQILGELAVITTLAVGAGVLLIVQLPLLDLISFLSAKVYLYSIILSAAMVFGLTLLCGLYPSWLATRVQPAEALHYE